MDLSGPLHIADLIVRSFAGKLTAEEEARLQQWRTESDANEALYQQIVSLKGLKETEKYVAGFSWLSSWKNFRQRVYGRVLPVRRIQILKYAALLIPFGLLLGLGWKMWRPEVSLPEKPEILSEHLAGVRPGGPKAILVLNDGSQVNLEEQAVFTTSDATVRNTGQSGTISYQKKKENKDQEIRINRLIVPNGGEYHIVLSDGTQVYLNAGSELTYPVNFAGTTREVSLKGEAYFKVSRQESCPFVVKTAGMDVRVLGTEFNLNAYEGQPYTSTTLVNGRVEIRPEHQEPVVLEPDQQARFDRKTSRVECVKVNTLPYIAWKDGKFVFYHETLESIAARLEKWYDVPVCFAEESLKEIRIFGIISRYEDIRQVLELLKSTQSVDFGMVDGKIEIRAAGGTMNDKR